MTIMIKFVIDVILAFQRKILFTLNVFIRQDGIGYAVVTPEAHSILSHRHGLFLFLSQVTVECGPGDHPPCAGMPSRAHVPSVRRRGKWTWRWCIMPSLLFHESRKTAKKAGKWKEGHGYLVSTKNLSRLCNCLVTNTLKWGGLEWRKYVLVITKTFWLKE